MNWWRLDQRELSELVVFRSKGTVRTSKIRINPLKTECRVIPTYDGGDRSEVTNYRWVSQLNLTGLSAEGTRHSRIPKTSLGYE